MRKKIVAGNWKMHGTRATAYALIEELKEQLAGFDRTKANVVLFPPFVHLQQTESLLVDTPIAWGGQNLYIGEQGAYTGEVSGPMLADYGCQYVLVGHSERRQLFKEGLELVAEKFQSALAYGLQPVLCVGETLEQRERLETENVVLEQLESVICVTGIEVFRHTVIAYEPVWAIGTGLTATPEQAQTAHVFIRDVIKRHHADIAQSIRILYGGSVKADNAKGLFAMPDIDGALVGGASLDAKSFTAICEAATK